MKIKFFLVLLALCYSLTLLGQTPTIDDKAQIMKRLSDIPEADPKPRSFNSIWSDLFSYNISDVEDNAMFASFDMTPDLSFFGGTVGLSWKYFMLDLSGRIGSQCEAGLESFKKGLTERSFYLTPQLYLKYFSVGCGFGTVSAIRRTTNTNVTDSEFGLLEQTTVKIKSEPLFSLRPVARGYIYVSDDIAFVLSVGYGFVVKHPEFNKLDFGLGIKWNLN